MLGILLPTASVLWFMSEAMTAQLAASRQEVTEGYRRQLRLVGTAITETWRRRAEMLQVTPEESPAAAFERLVTAGIADAVIVIDANGVPAYPQPVPTGFAATDDTLNYAPMLERGRTLEINQRFGEAETAYAGVARSALPQNLAAQAAQGAVRNALRQGATERAIGLIEEFFGAGNLGQGRDPLGRLIVADELLLLLDLLPGDDARQSATKERLVALINNYTADMPAAQRLFLMEAVGPTDVLFPTFRAERLAQAYVTTASGIDPGAAWMQPTRQSDIWRLSFADGQGVGLFHTRTIIAAAADVVAAEEAGVSFTGPAFRLVAPGESPGDESVAVGTLLPGWQAGFTLPQQALEAAANSRRVYYVWVGGIVVAAIAAAGVLLLAAYRQQIRIAALKTDLVAAVSHELRTPLASMRLLVDTLLEHGTEDKQRTRDYLELVARENTRLSRLIENFLEFSRLERQHQKFELSPVEPGLVVEIASAAVRERFEQAKCRLDLAVEPGLPFIDADRDALTTVLVNLLDNALKYTKENRRIALSASRSGAEVVFAVADNGIGIHARDQKRIFRRFYQVDRRLSRETGGVGLGLSIVDLIVRAHHGTVAVESEPGQGSTFSVRLPAKAAA